MRNNVYVVDDDPSIRGALERSLPIHGYEVIAFESGTQFLAEFDIGNYGCILLDIAMPGMTGMDVQAELVSRNCEMPIIFMTGHGDVRTSVRALKNGAVEFLEKPFQMDYLLELLISVMEEEAKREVDARSRFEIRQKYNSLTRREADVMASLVSDYANQTNKEIGAKLHLSHRTVEVYRARIMEKMGASTITHLVELAKACGQYQST